MGVGSAVAYHAWSGNLTGDPDPASDVMAGTESHRSRRESDDPEVVAKYKSDQANAGEEDRV